MIYRAIRGILKVALAVFFKKMTVTGIENIPGKGPVILVANHPNTFMDPIIIASIADQRIGFVANAGIFTNKFFSAVFRYFHVIPIFRKKDVASGEKPDNTEAFSKCHDYLNEGKTFLIFPEGSSYYELKLREIKTGTARIALSFDQLKNFESDLKIVPIALDYSDSIQFRSVVSVTVHPPLAIAGYRAAYKRDSFEGVKILTDDIRKALAESIPQTSDTEQENFLIKAHRFYTAYHETGADLYENAGRSLELRTQLSKAMHYVQGHSAGLYSELQNKIQRYFEMLKSEGVTTGFFTDEFLKKNCAFICFTYLLKFLVFMPLYVIGLAINYVPYILPSKIYEVMKIDISYKAPVQMIAGIITFPAFYLFAFWLFRHFISADLLPSVLFLALLPLSGYIAIYYWAELRRFARVIRFCFFMKQEKKAELLALRNDILAKIGEAANSLPERVSEPR